MAFESTRKLIEQVAQAVHELKVTLENHALPNLETAILNSQMALKSLENHPGGVDGLKQLIASFSEEQQKELNDRLAQARSDHQLNGELLRLAMQRNAALQAYAAQTSASAIYSSEGGVSFLGGGQLLGKF
jgi:flagellar biosynthesis/type III secretory pathway chaperone